MNVYRGALLVLITVSMLGCRDTTEAEAHTARIKELETANQHLRAELETASNQLENSQIQAEARLKAEKARIDDAVAEIRERLGAIEQSNLTTLTTERDLEKQRAALEKYEREYFNKMKRAMLEKRAHEKHLESTDPLWAFIEAEELAEEILEKLGHISKENRRLEKELEALRGADPGKHE